MRIQRSHDSGDYQAFYNPGGLIAKTSEAMRHSEQGSADQKHMIVAIDDPMRVSRSIQQ